MMPTLIKPSLLRLYNRWRKHKGAGEIWFRDAVIIVLTLAVMSGLYSGCVWVLRQTTLQLDFAYFHPSLVLGLIMTFLFAMLLATNSVSALGAFFMNKDLVTILASPIAPYRLFSGKCLQVVLSSSWMTVLFLLPVLLGFARFYHSPPLFWAAAAAVLLPYFIIPAALAAIIATGLILLLPAHHRRTLGIIASLLVLYGVYVMLDRLSAESGGRPAIDITGVLKVVAFLSVGNVHWMPPYLAATVLGELLEPTGKNILPHLTMLYAAALFLLAAAYVVVRLCYFAAYGRAESSARLRASSTLVRQRRLRAVTPFLPPHVRALISKEYRMAVRDFTQSMQAMFLLGLCAFYLYLLGIQDLLQQVVPEGQRMWWRTFLISTNLCLEAFVITAMSTRLVFPSISREAQAFWVLQSSPLPLRHILRVKYYCWLAPIAAVTSLIFGAAVFMLHGSPLLAAFKIASTLCLCTGLVGLAVGFGAYFADFDWEHPIQLTTGFGAMVYMVVGVLHVACNLFISAGVVVFAVINRTALLHADLTPWLMVSTGAAAIILLNAAVAYFSLKFGARALANRF